MPVYTCEEKDAGQQLGRKSEGFPFAALEFESIEATDKLDGEQSQADFQEQGGEGWGGTKSNQTADAVLARCRGQIFLHTPGETSSKLG